MISKIKDSLIKRFIKLFIKSKSQLKLILGLVEIQYKIII